MLKSTSWVEFMMPLVSSIISLIFAVVCTFPQVWKYCCRISAVIISPYVLLGSSNSSNGPWAGTIVLKKLLMLSNVSCFLVRLCAKNSEYSIWPFSSISTFEIISLISELDMFLMSASLSDVKNLVSYLSLVVW